MSTKSIYKNVFSKITYLFFPLLIALVNILIIIFPAETISSVKAGISLWANNVVPSLLVFIIGNNMLMMLGAVSFIGTLLEPVMVKLFNVPGCGGFALMAGLLSGYPLGAKTTAMLREENAVTAVEAQRLMGFVNNSGPLFIIGAVGVGMLNSAKTGYYILFVQFISALVMGCLFRFYKNTPRYVKTSNILSKAFKNMRLYRQKEGKNLGQILAVSVKNGIESILYIGGYIIIFCVFIRFTELINIYGTIANMFNLNNDANTVNGVIAGLIEMTTGLGKVSESGVTKSSVMLITGLICFGGFSIHAQTISFISGTDIKTGLYLASKLLQSVISMLLIYISYDSLNFSFHFSDTAQSIETGPVSVFSESGGFLSSFADKTILSLKYLAASLAIMLAVGIMYTLLSNRSRRKRNL